MEANIRDLGGITGLSNRRVCATGRLSIETPNGAHKRFEDCDFFCDVQGGCVTNCTFFGCRFEGKLEDVQFSDCRFEYCHFSQVSFIRCNFLDNCLFKANSALPEHLRMDDTAVSATKFLNGLETNLKYLPKDVSEQYQQWQFGRAKEQMARMLFVATRNAPDMKVFCEGKKEMIRHSLDQQVERFRFKWRVDKYVPRHNFRFLIRSLVPRFERFILKTCGWLTGWGMSIVPAFLFFILVCIVFGLLYLLLDPSNTSFTMSTLTSSVLRALNITVVAGYTTYFSLKEPLSLQLLTFLNLALGIFWYSLLIPVLANRVLR